MDLPEKDNSLLGRLRDKTAWALASFALTWIATPWYRDMISGAIRLGLDTAVKEED